MDECDSERVGGVEIRTWLTDASIDDFEPFGVFGSHRDGAVLIFQGRVRETNEGRAVRRVDYEAYGEMAERELKTICREAAVAFEVGAIYAAHRVGRLGLGEVSVAIGVSAPHRDRCYEASRFVIEQIKSRLPIWKHEHYVDGASGWVGSPSGGTPTTTDAESEDS